MQRTRSVLRLGCPVRFRDRWQGRLAALEVDDQWLVLNLVLSHGIFRPTEVKLPFTTASQWDDNAVSLDCTSYEAFDRQIPPVAVPARPLSARTPLAAGDARLAGVQVETASRRAGHLLLRRGLLASDLRLVPITDVVLEGGTIKLATQWHALPVYRRDPDLLQAVREALAVHPYLTADDRRGLAVEIVDGTAYVSGNVRTPQAEAYVHEAAVSVPGVTAVGGALTNDRQLEIEIGRALDVAGLFRHARVYVRAALGDVTIGGFVATEAATPDILRVVSAVPGVRSVEDRMEVESAAPPPPGALPEAAAGGPGTPEA